MLPRSSRPNCAASGTAWSTASAESAGIGAVHRGGLYGAFDFGAVFVYTRSSGWCSGWTVDVRRADPDRWRTSLPTSIRENRFADKSGVVRRIVTMTVTGAEWTGRRRMQVTADGPGFDDVTPIESTEATSSRSLRPGHRLSGFVRSARYPGAVLPREPAGPAHPHDPFRPPRGRAP